MLKSLAVCIFRQLSAKNFSSTSALKVVEDKSISALREKHSAEFNEDDSLVTTVNVKQVNDNKLKEWRSHIHIFKDHGFEDSTSLEIISNYPFLLHMPPTDLNNVLHQWDGCAFGFENSKDLFCSQPHLLEVETESIRKRIPYLNSLFKSSKSTVTLLKSSPNIMFDDWSATLNKIDYLLKVQRVERRELLQSFALSKSLDLIMLRFEILDKCGLYKKPTKYAHKKNKYDSTGFKNPHLAQITDLSDELFAKKTAQITLEEYQVYKDLFEIPVKNNEDEEDDDDDDYDNDNDSGTRFCKKDM